MGIEGKSTLVLTRANSTVLVVDDDASIREYLTEVLRLEGYECHSFPGSSASSSRTS